MRKLVRNRASATAPVGGGSQVSAPAGGSQALQVSEASSQGTALQVVEQPASTGQEMGGGRGGEQGDSGAARHEDGAVRRGRSRGGGTSEGESRGTSGGVGQRAEDDAAANDTTTNGSRESARWVVPQCPSDAQQLPPYQIPSECTISDAQEMAPSMPQLWCRWPHFSPSLVQFTPATSD